MTPPNCPHCSKPLTRVLDLPYGWWEWEGSKYALSTASKRVDVAPWVHADCMGELRDFHPQDVVTTA
jgi:hypothetical protein